MAALGVVARRRGRWSLPAALAAPALIVVDTAVLTSGPNHLRRWVITGALLIATTLTVTLVRAVRRTGALPAAG